MDTIIVTDCFGEPHLLKLALQEEFFKRNITHSFQPHTQAGDLAFDPSSLVISGTALLTAVLSGTFSYLSTKKKGIIEIVGASGRRVAVPVDKADQLAAIIEAAKDLDVAQVIARP